MKKLALLLAIILVVAVPVQAQAATSRASTIIPELTFSGATANCAAVIVGDAGTDSIEATIKLRSSGSVIQTWYITGTGYINWRDTATVAQGRYYILTVDVTVNDISIGQVFTDGTCP